jgi:hypothetical protein
MKQMYSITTAIVSLLLLILAIYIGAIWMIDESRREINRIEVKIDAENIPPPPEYFKAYAWVKWGGDCDIKRAYFTAKNTLSATFGDFRYEFGRIFSDSIHFPLAANVWFLPSDKPNEKFLSMDELKLSNKPLYNVLKNPRDVSWEFLKGELQIPKLDKKEYSYLFDFLTKSNALQNTCNGWLPFLELYAKEENDSSALNCCKDILAFRPDS